MKECIPACGMVINMVAYKDHLGECKGKIAKVIAN